MAVAMQIDFDGPFAQEAGIASRPQLQFFEVHNYFTPGSSSQAGRRG
ncbi:MAG: hypothetical protein ACR2LJ_01730 [Acidimicrobiales bacterium]